ncbi:hypothetical protein [Jeotgalibacillus soli]|uniref:Uncharacterized protein n=1 Tax=Jeotgalibacillus soli TaxID=889306 RepID=A0A0C2V6H0_9BACL|nr:hypothetical protein [Jeotgalibacillus soli]KIL44562.1 hypothetical protein KP78_35260 [Jeotgalibacillus soli]
MLNKLTKKQIAFIVLFSLLLFILLFFYLFVVRSVVTEAQLMEERVLDLETASEILRVTPITESEVDQENRRVYERKVPNERQVDQLLLAIQEAELISGVRIESITFNHYDGSIVDTGLTINNLLSGQSTEESDMIGNDGRTEEELEVPSSSPISNDIDMPEELKLITFSADIMAPNFNQAMQFLREIEKLERISRVDSLHFTQSTEDDRVFSDSEDESVFMNIQVTTFYYTEEDVAAP